MAMNRAQKRLMQRQGALGADGEPARPQQQRRAPATPRPEQKEARTKPRQFLKEVRAELRKVAWPSRPEVINYSIVVLVTVVVLTAIIAGLDYLFSEFVLTLFD